MSAEPRRYERGPRRGEERRSALLRALRELLESQPLAKIGIADIARAAGVTRPAFYFYFATKAMAVAALLEDVYDDLLDATGKWHSVAGPAQRQLHAGFDALMDYCGRNPGLMVAILDAVGSDAEVRELWEHWMNELADRVAEKIVLERAAGRAPAGADAGAVAHALVGMNERVLERQVRAIVGGGEPAAEATTALFEIWQRTIYGTTGDGR